MYLKYCLLWIPSCRTALKPLIHPTIWIWSGRWISHARWNLRSKWRSSCLLLSSTRGFRVLPRTFNRCPTKSPRTSVMVQSRCSVTRVFHSTGIPWWFFIPYVRYVCYWSISSCPLVDQGGICTGFCPPSELDECAVQLDLPSLTLFQKCLK